MCIIYLKILCIGSAIYQFKLYLRYSQWPYEESQPVVGILTNKPTVTEKATPRASATQISINAQGFSN